MARTLIRSSRPRNPRDISPDRTKNAAAVIGVRPGGSESAAAVLEPTTILPSVIWRNQANRGRAAGVWRNKATEGGVTYFSKTKPPRESKLNQTIRGNAARARSQPRSCGTLVGACYTAYNLARSQSEISLMVGAVRQHAPILS